MKNKVNEFNGYMTVYLSLIFTIILSLILALIEGAAIGALRAQSELIADLGMDSAFAEYNREILEQYDLLFVDTSYGDIYGGVGELREHIKDYMDYNMNPKKGIAIGDMSTLLAVDALQLEIEEVSYACDDNGNVWKAHAINYMKAVYGGDLISAVKNNISTISENALDSCSIKDNVSEQKQAFEEALIQRNITEYSSESEEGYSYKKLSDTFDYVISEGILSLLIPDGSKVSNRYIESNQYLSKRKAAGKINKGSGLREGLDRPKHIDDELIYGEYLLRKYGSYVNPKENGKIGYQLEYILSGENSDVSNLRAYASKLFALRSASNFIYLSNDSFRHTEVSVVSTVICTILGVPDMSDMLTNIILGVWAMAEAVVDVRTIFNGGNVPLLKENNSWKLSISSLFTMDIFVTNDNSEGLDYEGYLRIFLGLMDKKEKVLRSLDIVEMDIRNAEGNETFRIDRCIDYMKVNFGFIDANGHDFVFSRSMCY